MKSGWSISDDTSLKVAASGEMPSRSATEETAAFADDRATGGCTYFTDQPGHQSHLIRSLSKNYLGIHKRLKVFLVRGEESEGRSVS